MDSSLKELIVARVCSGTVRISVDHRGRERRYVVKRPTRDQQYYAAELYDEVSRDSQLDGLYTDDELVEFLLEQGFWDEQRQLSLEQLPKQIEEAKVALYKAIFKSNERLVIRKALAIAKAEYLRLSDERNSYGYLSCSGAAAIAKTRYLVGVGLHTLDGKSLFTDETFWDADSTLLDEAMTSYSKTRIDESKFREISRTDPWRTIWSGAKVERSLFGTPPVDWTEEQKSIVNWSLLFDNVYQHPDCPADAVIEDDDLMDGWLICQRRERDNRANAVSDEVVTNEAIRNSQEVMIPADTIDDARKVINLNDDMGKAVQKQRFDYLKNKGTVSEEDMPDTRLRLRMEATNLLSATMAKK